MFFVVFFVALSIVVGFAVMRRSNARARKRLEEAAARLGLQVVDGTEALKARIADSTAELPAGTPPLAKMPPVLLRMLSGMAPPRLAGVYQGVHVSVYTETHSSGKGSHQETVFKAYYAKPLPFDLHMAREGVGARIAKALGGQDVEVGEPAFDAAVRVKTKDPDAVRAWFASPTRRHATVTAVAACPGLRATSTCVTFERQGSLRGADEIASVLGAIAPLASAMGD